MLKDLLDNHILSAIKKKLNNGNSDFMLFFKGSHKHYPFYVHVCTHSITPVEMGDSFRPSYIIERNEISNDEILELAKQLLKGFKYGYNQRDYSVMYQFPKNFNMDSLNNGNGF